LAIPGRCAASPGHLSPTRKDQRITKQEQRRIAAELRNAANALHHSAILVHRLVRDGRLARSVNSETIRVQAGEVADALEKLASELDETQ
jgi:hypothetical protein